MLNLKQPQDVRLSLFLSTELKKLFLPSHGKTAFYLHTGSTIPYISKHNVNKI